MLELLRTFLAVHRAGSFTKAAAILGLSQPAVSNQIHALEEQLGIELFVRRPRGARPTGPADLLAARVAPHLDGLADVVATTIGDTNPYEHTLHLAGPADFLAARVIPALARLVAQGLMIRVCHGRPDQLLDGLAAGHHDLVISTVRPRKHGITETALADEELLLVARPEWRTRLAGDPDGGDVFSDAPLLAYDDDLPLIRRYWSTVFARQPTTSPALILPDLRGLLAAVTAGAGITVLPDYLAADLVNRGELAVLHSPEIPPINTLYLAERTGPRAPRVELVRRQLLSQANRW